MRTMGNSDVLCEFCDLPLYSCSHGQPARIRRVSSYLEVSPSSVAHFPGCPHKDDSDYSRWGRITRAVESAWQQLGRGEPLVCDESDDSGRRATRRCADCVDHGAWNRVAGVEMPALADMADKLHYDKTA
ncbi:hypothetical protein GCM10009599_22170 [Luteococcus peritonei]